MKRFEYCYLQIENNSYYKDKEFGKSGAITDNEIAIEQLDCLGDKGWELVLIGDGIA